MLPLLNAADTEQGPQPNGSGSAGVPAGPGGNPGQEKNLSKVELDLDGAPFLEEEPPKPEAAPPKAEAPAPKKPAPEPGEAKPKKSKKKLIIIAGAALLLLGLAAGAYFMFFAGDGKPKEEEAVIITLPSGPILEPAPVDDFTIDFPPFWVELEDPSGEMRILVCKVLLPTNSSNNVLEIKAKNIIIRDAIYYYLRNKDYEFLADNTKLEEIKKDIANIINEYLMTEKISEVLLDNYIIR